MARSARTDVGNYPYHVINRAIGRLKIFSSAKDYILFLELLADAAGELNMRVLAFVVMPNHWHLVLYPRNDGDMGLFMHKLTNSHTRKVHAMTKTTGTGPLYQGRYKSFLIQQDKHLLTVIKYVERNPVRARLLKTCEDYRWGSAWIRKYGSKKQKKLLANPPVEFPGAYFSWINQAEAEADQGRVRESVKRGSPLGTETWVTKMVGKHDLSSTIRPPGRPKKI